MSKVAIMVPIVNILNVHILPGTGLRLYIHYSFNSHKNPIRYIWFMGLILCMQKLRLNEQNSCP